MGAFDSGSSTVSSRLPARNWVWETETCFNTHRSTYDGPFSVLGSSCTPVSDLTNNTTRGGPVIDYFQATVPPRCTSRTIFHSTYLAVAGSMDHIYGLSTVYETGQDGVERALKVEEE